MVKLGGSKVLILVIRAVLLAVAAGSIAMAVVLARGKTHAWVSEQATTSFVCPMHPEVTSAAPADCPICGMALESTSARQGTTAKTSFQLPIGAAPLTNKGIGRAQPHDSPQDMRVLAWAEGPDCLRALFYLDQIALFRPDEDAFFTPAVRSGGGPQEIHLRKQHEPPAPWDAKTALVSFRPLTSVRLVPGQTGSLKLAARFRKDLVIPASAVIQSPAGPYVLLIEEDRLTLTPRPIAIGSTTYGLTAILSGLKEGQRMVAARAFLYDAERRLATRMSP